MISSFKAQPSSGVVILSGMTENCFVLILFSLLIFKVVIRRLPPTLTKEHLQEHLQPMPEHDYFEFFSNDTR